jgi:ribosomal protein S18 acetylase RimI-like enzyme
LAADVDIQPGEAHDASDLFAFAKSAFGGQGGWDDARALQALERDNVFVARVGGSVAGYVALRRAGEAMLVEQLLVAPHHEGEGIGHRLLAHAEGFAISAGAGSMQIVVEDDNDRALAFYRRSGFVPVDEQLYELSLPVRS